MKNEFILEYNKENAYTLEADLIDDCKKAIIKSLITAFGLDMFIQDRHGGDVDTVHNVRKIGSDEKMGYKNRKNESDYDDRGEYDRTKYHSDSTFAKVKRDAKKTFNETGEGIDDAYTGEKVYPNKGASINKQGQLDHVISAKNSHDDRGRVLAGVDGIKLANLPDNLQWTNAALNNNMRDKTVEEYISWCEEHPNQVNWNGKKGEPLPEEVKERLREAERNAKRAQDLEINKAYYTSKKFYTDLSVQALKRGAQMGAREAMGIIFAEIWFSVEEEIMQYKNSSDAFDAEELCERIGEGIKKGFQNSLEKYDDILKKSLGAALQGSISSLITSLVNTFATTPAVVVALIRQCSPYVYQATKEFVINPKDLVTGQLTFECARIISTGVSVAAGTLIRNLVETTGIEAVPIVGKIIVNFCGALVSGLLNAILFFMLTRDFMIKIYKWLDDQPSAYHVVNVIKQDINLLDEYIASLYQIDIKKINELNKIIESINADIDKTDSYDAVIILEDYVKKLGIEEPYGENNSFDDVLNKNKEVIIKL